MRNYAGRCKSICSYNLVYNLLTQLLPLKSLVFVVHLLNVFQHGKEAFPNGSFQNEIVPLLVVFHLPYSKYESVKMFSLVWQPCCSCSTRVALVSHSCCLCLTRVTLVLLFSHSCCILSLHLHSCHSWLALVLKIRLDPFFIKKS